MVGSASWWLLAMIRFFMGPRLSILNFSILDAIKDDVTGKGVFDMGRDVLGSAGQSFEKREYKVSIQCWMQSNARCESSMEAECDSSPTTEVLYESAPPASQSVPIHSVWS